MNHLVLTDFPNIVQQSYSSQFTDGRFEGKKAYTSSYT